MVKDLGSSARSLSDNAIYVNVGDKPVAIDRKVYVRKKHQVIVYDPRDGKCGKIYTPKDINYTCV